MPPDEDEPRVEGPLNAKEDAEGSDDEHDAPALDRAVLQTSYMNSSAAKVFAEQRRKREPGVAESFVRKWARDAKLFRKLMGGR